MRLKKQQIEQIKRWMLGNDVLEIQIEDDEVYVFEPKTHTDMQIFIDGWLDGDITTEQFEEFLETRYWWVQYFLDDFLKRVKEETQEQKVTA